MTNVSKNVGTTYSTVIVTRNRPDALALSVPLHLMQSRLPERLLIIDSSDDPSANRALVDQWTSKAAVPLEHHIAPAGMTVQRNIGLGRITSDVVFFPDDDSLVYPEALARMMKIYDLDTQGRIGGVCAAEASHPPPGVLEAQKDVYKKRKADVFRTQIGPLRARLEDRFFPDPMKLVARRLQAGLLPPEDWMATQNAAWVAWMTGFRMSFRTSVIRKVGFNENLGRYALYEDVDAGFGVLASGYSLVAARHAQIYHHKTPESRTDGRQMGVIDILNRAYIVLRSGVVDDRIIASLKRHARSRIAQFSVGSGSTYGKARLAGAKAAYRVLPELLSSPPYELDDVYLKLRQVCLDKDP